MNTADAVTMVGDRFGWSGQPVEVAAPHGTVWVFAELDEFEHDDRRDRDVGSVTDLAVLAALTELPHQMPVPAASLAPHTRQVLDTAPPGIVRASDDGHVERLVRRPVRVHGAVAAGRWSTVNRHVGAFGTLAEVAVLTRQRPRPAGGPTLQAAVWGQGLAFWAPDDTIEVVQHPEPSLRLPGAYQWWLTEIVYWAMTARTVTASPTA